jgi:AraC-like DNA-binding protein
MEFVLAVWVRAGRAVTGIEWSPLEVRFGHAAPRDAGDHERFFRAPVRFRMGENAFTLAAELLALPCTRADAALAALLDRYAAERIARAPGAGRLADRVHALLEAGLRSGEVSATSLARRLGMSVRSLNRLLATEGTSYQKALDSLRHELAARQLSDPGTPVSEVAFQLGFSDLSSFYRAFRRWTGTTPAEFRGRASAPGGSAPAGDSAAGQRPEPAA